MRRQRTQFFILIYSGAVRYYEMFKQYYFLSIGLRALYVCRQRHTNMFYVLPKTLFKALLLLHQTKDFSIYEIFVSIIVLPVHFWDLPGQMFLCIKLVLTVLSNCCIIHRQAPWASGISRAHPQSTTSMEKFCQHISANGRLFCFKL